MKPGDIAIWHPKVLSGVPRRVRVHTMGVEFCRVSIPAGDPNPNGNPYYMARPNELSRPAGAVVGQA